MCPAWRIACKCGHFLAILIGFTCGSKGWGGEGANAKNKEIEIRGAVVSFTPQELEGLPLPPEAASSADWLQLRTNGAGALCFPFLLLVPDGEKAEVRDVEEVIFPEAYDVEIEDPSPMRTKKFYGPPSLQIVPGAFQARDIGRKIKLESVASPLENEILMALEVEFTEIRKWEDAGPDILLPGGAPSRRRFLKPVISHRKFSSRLTLSPGGMFAINTGWKTDAHALQILFVSAVKCP